MCAHWWVGELTLVVSGPGPGLHLETHFLGPCGLPYQSGAESLERVWLFV